VATQELAKDFLTFKRFAVVGVSRDPREFSRRLFEELLKRGYDAIPVNKNTAELDGRPCFLRPQDIKPPVKGALLMTSRDVTEQALRDCAEAGIRLVWIFGISGPKSIGRQSVELCKELGLAVIPGYCPYMFIPGADWFHRFHAGFLKIVGRYPV